MEQCNAVYKLNNKRCSRQKGHAGEHCHIIWDRNEGERREWWKDYNVYDELKGENSYGSI